MSDKKTLGAELRRRRMAAGLTVAELSTRSRLREAYLTAIEENREEPSAGALQRVAQQLDPSGAVYEELAHRLVGPDFDSAGEMSHRTPKSESTIDAGPVPDRVVDVWRQKTDWQVLAAAAAIGEYTEHGQRAIQLEMERRGLDKSRPDLTVQAASPAAPSTALEFDLVINPTGPSAAGAPAVSCEACHQSITTEYFQVNGLLCCGRCRMALETFAETPRGARPFLVAGSFGLGAGIVGAAVYYAVIAIAHLEIGIVAILIGYMVGRAVRKGAGGRGGRRFQVLAAALTYASVALAYTPVVIKGAIDARSAQKAQATANINRAAVATDGGRAVSPQPTGRGFIVALLVLFAVIAALPVIIVVGSFPSGLISGFIIFIGMRQAWRMTGAPRFDVLGPYRVGVAPVAAPA